MSNRPIVYLFAGVLCAGIAVVVAYKYLSSKSPGEESMETVQIVLAAGEIPFGSELALRDQENEGNVAFAPWPKKYVPKGAIKKENADTLTGRTMIAKTSFVRHQTILEPLIQAKDEFVTPDLYLEPIHVDPEEMASLTPGMKVDVFKVRGKEVDEFIRSAVVYAVGKLPSPGGDSKGDKDKDVPPIVHVLLPLTHSETVLRATYEAKLVLRPARMPSEAGPVFVPAASDERKEAVAEELFSIGSDLQRAGEPQAAWFLFDRIVTHFPSAARREQAGAAKLDCERAQAEGLYRQALAAMEAKEYARCIELCRTVQQDYAGFQTTVEKTARLLDLALQVQEGQSRKRAYQELCSQLGSSLKAGEFAEVELYLERLAAQFADFEPPPPLTPPDKIIGEYRRKLKDAKGEFELLKSVFAHYLEAGDREEALAKLKKIKERFPTHPFVLQAEDGLRRRGWLE